jgi:1-acyl-sn-glycerol-3-phosphate acyltransferase
MRISAAWGLRAHFKKIHYSGFENIPFDQPVLFAANHTNALIDPVALGGFMAHPLHFLTRADVFTPSTEPIFEKLNMYPIYRIRDGYHLLSRNETTFAKCFEILKDKGRIVIFSEGDCFANKQLRPLKKGTARMAFQALEEFDLNVQIVPTSINYTKHSAFRSEIMVAFDQPFGVKDFADIHTQNKARGIKAFNKQLQTAIKKNLVHLDNLENKELLEALLPIIRSALPVRKVPIFDTKENARLKGEKSAADYINHLDNSPETEEMNIFKEQVFNFSQQLNKYNIKIEAFEKTPNWLPLILMILCFPVFLAAVALNGLPYFVANYFAKNKVEEEIYISTFRSFIMTYSYLALWLILSIIAIVFLGWLGLAFAALMPISAFGLLFYKEALDMELARLRFSFFEKKQPIIAKQLIKEKKEILKTIL